MGLCEMGRNATERVVENGGELKKKKKTW